MADKRKPLILTLDPVEPSPEDEDAAGDVMVLGAEAPGARVPEVAGGADVSRVQAVALRRQRDQAAATAGEATPPPVRVKVAKPPRTPRPPKPPKPPKPMVRPERRVDAAAPPREAGLRLARWAYPTAIVAAVLWAGCLVTFVVGYERGGAGFEFAPLRWTVTALLALLPAALMLVFGYMVRQSARLAEESRRTQAMADAMSAPAALAGAHAHGAIGVMCEEIARAQAAADEVARRMAALGDSLAEETRRVSEAAVQAERAASRLGGRLQSERAELSSLSGTLDAQLASAAEGAARHARLAAEASDLAQANLHEAQAALAARTADLMAAAGEAARVSDGAGAELAQRGDRLERLADGLRRQQAEWAAVAQALLSDQEDMAARLESERARFGDAATEARAAAGELQTAAAEGSGALKRLAGEAEAAGEAARTRAEGLAEAAFAAGQRADQAFDSRLTAARRALESQAALIEEVGLRSAARIEAGLEEVRAALREAQAAPAAAPANAPAPPNPGVAPETEARAGDGFAQLGRAVEGPSKPADAPAADTAAVPPLRPRLQLAAAADEDLFKPSSRPAPAGTVEADGDEWSWKDLLTAIDDPQPMDDDALAERMIGEIEAMGVDPGALLPRARIDEIARAVDAGDGGRVREAVRRLAPAAVRRLSRRVLTDKVLRGQADLYRRRYGDLVRDEQSRHGGDGNGAVSALLGSDPGRAFLLLDAAVGDLH